MIEENNDDTACGYRLVRYERSDLPPIEDIINLEDSNDLSIVYSMTGVDINDTGEQSNLVSHRQRYKVSSKDAIDVLTDLAILKENIEWIVKILEASPDVFTVVSNQRIEKKIERIALLGDSARHTFKNVSKKIKRANQGTMCRVKENEVK